MKRVLLVMGNSVGGIGQHVRSLAQGLARRRYQVLVAGPPETDEHFGFSQTGARFVPIEIGDRPRHYWSPRLGRIARGADVVHAHGLRAGFVAVTSVRGRGAPPIVVTWHNQPLATGLTGRSQRLFEQVVARGATLTLGASQDLVERAAAEGANARYLPVAAPRLPEPERSMAEMRANLGVGDGPCLLAIGRLQEQKDYPTMFAAVGLLADRDPVPTLVVAGQGPLYDELRLQASQSSTPIKLLGHRADVADLLRAADVLVLTSVWEARALVVQEAMLAGVPVVATDVGGIAELTGDAAVLVPRGDPQACALGVAALLDDPAMAAQLVAAARARALTWPDEDEVVDLVDDVYDEVLQDSA